jgi:hypothetical protein
MQILTVSISNDKTTVTVRGTCFYAGNRVTCVLVPSGVEGTLTNPVAVVPDADGNWTATFNVPGMFASEAYMVKTSARAEGSCSTILTVP